jgi:hypothetical protein
MDDEIKSAREIAMEKLAEIGETTEEERLEWKYVPEGEKLAAQYLKEGANLTLELGQYEEPAKRFVIQGLSTVLIRNINLPASDLAKRTNKQAMEGLKIAKRDHVGVENIYSKMRRIFDHYSGEGAQQKKQAYEALKYEFAAQVKQAMQQQLGTFTGFRIDIEKQPQFQTEWRRRELQLDSQYLTILEEYKQELSAIP